MEPINISIKEEPKGTFSCDLDISVEEWKGLLTDNSVTTQNYKEALLSFYHEPSHKSTCKLLSIKYHGNAKDAQKFNAWITKFGEAVVKKLNRFHIIDKDGSERFWHVAINPGKSLNNGLFEWQLRDELVEAIESLGWNKKCTWIPFYMEMADKLLSFKNNRKALLDIVYELDKKYVGYIKDDNGGHVKDIDPFTIFGIFNRGLTNQNRVQLAEYFKKKFAIKSELPLDFDGIPVVNNMMATFTWREHVDTDIQPLWNLFETALDKDRENLTKWFDVVCKQQGIKWNITMGLFWIRPYEYISLDSRNREYLPKIGIGVFKESEIDSKHYLNLLDNVIHKIETKTIKETCIPDISVNAWVVGNTKSIWLVGYAFGSTDSQIERFLKESTWEGRFDEQSTSDQKLLKQVKSIRTGDILVLKSTSTKGKNHDQPFLRVKAVGVVTNDLEISTLDNLTVCKFNVSYINNEEKDFDGSRYGAYRKTIHLADNTVQPIIDYINSILNNKTIPQMKYKKYIDILLANKNLVLTGAPGTGKTYIAQAMAEEMGAETKFVQFHPSYDYTDFVEGLRPVEKEDGQMGFERKDGVFKEFCRDAIKNLLDSEKSIESLTNELSWQEKLERFVDDAIEQGTKFKTVNGSEFVISDMKNHTIVIHNEQNEKTTQVSVNADDILELLSNNVPLNIVRDIRNYFQRKFGTQPDSYAYVITKAVRAMKQKVPVVEANKVERKSFVFIIDEINRGEASKIFGELFYAIDPGYRGKKDNMVQTQYQNLVPETDVFSKGFYVPENVYILATMNDIDRSVESMDFAMRRRFTWKEVTPADTISMLDTLPSADEAKATMNRLNITISETDGLGAAYQIGPSYFLKLRENGGDFNMLWEMNIEPLLKEYLRGFRKTAEILDKFKNSYFATEDKTISESTELIDED